MCFLLYFWCLHYLGFCFTAVTLTSTAWFTKVICFGAADRHGGILGITAAPSIQGDSFGLQSISKPAVSFTVSSVGLVPCRVQEFLNRGDLVHCRFWCNTAIKGVVGLVEVSWASAVYEKMMCLLRVCTVDLFVVCLINRLFIKHSFFFFL